MLYAEDFVFACIDPTTGSIVRGKTPWYIWPAAHPTHLQIPCVCLVVLELLADEALQLESGRLVAGLAEPSDPLPSTYRRVICEAGGPLKKQLKAACWYKHEGLPSDARPRFYRRSNPWWMLLHRLVTAGRLAYVGSEGGSLRAPRVRMIDTVHRTELLETLRSSVAASAFTTPHEAGLVAALRAAHLERLVGGGQEARTAPAWAASALPLGGAEVLAFLRRASQSMTTS